MSQSTPNSRAPSPPPAPAAARGGSRLGSGQRSRTKRARQESVAAARVAHARLLQRRQRLAEGIASLSNPSGRSLSSNELRIIIRLALWLQLHEDYSEAAAVEAASVWAGSSRHTVEPAYRHWWETGELLEPDASQRGSGNPLHPRHAGSVTFDQILDIHRILAEAKIKNKYLPVKELKKQVALGLSERQIRRILKQLGYKWRRKRCIGRMNKEQRAQRTRSFIEQYDVALKEQQYGSAVIVYVDESYLHTAHSNQFCWALSADAQGHHVRGLPSKGKRLIILHAMTADGLLHLEQRGRNASSITNVVSDECKSCELIFEGLVDSEDYHKNMNSTVFMQWVRNRLIPTFRAKYGRNKKLILVLDNARYHHPHGESWVSPNAMNKEQLAAWIASNPRGENGIRIQRNGREKYFGKTALFQHGSAFAPTVAEMKAWVKADLQSHPDTNRTLLQEEFDRLGYQTIYTPPYECETQPIELLWAYVKNYVGRVMGDDHSIAAVTQLARQGFYGDTATNHAGVDSDLCARLIGHVHTYLNAFIKADEELQGSLGQLGEGEAAADDPFDDMDDEEEIEEDDRAMEQEEESDSEGMQDDDDDG
jgi:transposase